MVVRKGTSCPEVANQPFWKRLHSIRPVVSRVMMIILHSARKKIQYPPLPLPRQSISSL